VSTSVRVGLGFDVHPFAPNADGDDGDGRPLVLGGVAFDGERALDGHSDADVVAHAVIDALLGAAGLGDIGTHFPDTDPSLAGADSVALLRAASTSVAAAGWRAVNVDCAVVLDSPKLAPHRDAMQQRLSDAAGAPVTVKAKRTEGVGALGRGDGIACWAVALVERA
jgi:2-C-methyl-D-erythritol 2,4-cyclodiphosphate synthase